MNRYALPLVLTIALYVGVITTLMFSLDNTNEITRQNKSEQRVTFTIISQPPVEQVKAQEHLRVEKKVQEIQKQKPLLEKIVKKIEKPKIIKTAKIKKKPIKKEKIVEVKKEEILKPKKEKITKLAQAVALPIAKPELQENTATLQNKLNVEADKKKLIDKQKSLYFSKIKECISENKVYPRIARKRGIEDSVKVKFVISKDGKFIAFTSIDCKSVFKKSVEQAIVTSFPLKPQTGLFNENINISLTINYTLL